MSSVVNKLVFNCLVQYGNVALPEVGSLHVEGEPKQVFFSEKISDNHIPVTEIIAEYGALSSEEALRLYHDWLAEARKEDGSIVVEDVGTITPRHFDIHSELHRALNGDGMPVATLKKRSRTWVWWVAALLVVGGGVAAWLLCPCCNKCSAPEEVVVEAVVEPVVEEVVEVPAVEEPKVANPPAPDKRYNVAVGVFTIKYNARACAKQDPLGIGAENYTITPFPSDLWVVIAYSTDNLNDAERMRKKYKKIQSDVWVYRRY